MCLWGHLRTLTIRKDGARRQSGSKEDNREEEDRGPQTGGEEEDRGTSQTGGEEEDRGTAWYREHGPEGEVGVDLAKVRETYYEASGKLSDIVRQLAFAGIAVVWLFGYLVSDQRLDPEYVWPALLIILSLACDFLQYAYRTAAWGIYGWWIEKSNRDKAEFRAPRMINWPSLFLFCSKAVLLAAAYVQLGLRLRQRLL
jgi:hypothetical protein